MPGTGRATASSQRCLHHAPCAVAADQANILIVLPERAYANDCHAVEFAAADRIRIAV